MLYQYIIFYRRLLPGTPPSPFSISVTDRFEGWETVISILASFPVDKARKINIDGYPVDSGSPKM